MEIDDSGPVGWIRPVSSRAGAEVSEAERQYKNGSDPKVLDIISIPLLEEVGQGYQSENWLLDPDRYWVKKGKAAWEDLVGLEDPIAPLWPSTSSDTYNGSNDRVLIEEIECIDHSLRLVRVSELKVHVFAPGVQWGNSKRRVQGEFTYAGAMYRVWISDPLVERHYLAQENGTYTIGECFLTMSLSEPHKDGYCYKLIAAVIERDS